VWYDLASRLGQGAQLLGRMAILFLFRLTQVWDAVQRPDAIVREKGVKGAKP